MRPFAIGSAHIWSKMWGGKMRRAVKEAQEELLKIREILKTCSETRTSRARSGFKMH